MKGWKQSVWCVWCHDWVLLPHQHPTVHWPDGPLIQTKARRAQEAEP